MVHPSLNPHSQNAHQSGPAHQPGPAHPYGLPTADGGQPPQAVGQPTPDHAPPATDPAPVLEPIGGQYGAEDSTEGVSLGTLPAFKDLRRVLPAERMSATAALARVAKALPASLQTPDGTPADLDSLDSISADDLDAVADMFTQAQDVVLDWAMDREAMTEWLLDQDDPMAAVMAAFSRFQAHLGN